MKYQEDGPLKQQILLTK